MEGQVVRYILGENDYTGAIFRKEGGIIGVERGPEDFRSSVIATRGLVDFHAHLFEHETPLGLHADEVCFNRGVYIAVDAGSAGADDIAAFKDHCSTRRTHILSYIHVSREGLTKAGCVGPDGHGECDEVSQIDASAAVRAAESNRDFVIGVKVRLSKDACGKGDNELLAFDRALAVSSQLGLPLMVHHALSGLSIDDVMSRLRTDDIYTHCFHDYPPNILNINGDKIAPCVVEARKRGVKFCIGHGRGSFSWKVAKVATHHEFWPDFISSDLHRENLGGPVFELWNVASKMLHIGMSLTNIVNAMTTKPFEHLIKFLPLEQSRKLEEEWSRSLVLFEIATGDVQLADFRAAIEVAKRTFVPKMLYTSTGILPIKGIPYEVLDDIKEELKHEAEYYLFRHSDQPGIRGR